MLSFFIVAAPEIETPERAQCRDLSGRAKQLSPAMSPKKPQPPPKPSDLKYFFFVRPTLALTRRRAPSTGAGRVQRLVGRSFAC